MEQPRSRGGKGRNHGRHGGGRGSIGRGRGHEAANATHTQPNATASAEENRATVTADFSPEQVQQLLSLIETPKSGHEKLSGEQIWQLDSKASCHMTSSLDSICDVRDIEPISAKLPNGTVTMAAEHRTICLSPNLKLNNVLYVPDLNCSFISIA